MGNLDKLPKWARERIEALERNLAHVSDELTKLQTKEFGGSGVVSINNYTHGSTFLPDGAMINFVVNDGVISIRRDHGELYLMASAVHSSRIYMSPSATNTAYVGVHRDG